MKEVYEIVLSYPKLSERIHGKLEEQAKVIKIVDEIKAQFSEKAASLLVKFIDTTFIHLYEGINIDTVVEYDLASNILNNHVVLVPNHQSHADYVALNYIIYKKFKVPIFVAGGINLNIPLLGKLFIS
jgi:glycerol-3-phosphate O-acyltransferase